MPTWISHPFQKVWLVAVEIPRHPVIHLEFRWFFGMFFWGGKSYLLSWGVWMSRCLFFVSVETTRYSPWNQHIAWKWETWEMNIPLEMVPFQGTHVNSRWEVISLTYFRVVSSQLQSIKYIMHEITVGDIRRDTQRAIPDDHRPWTPLIDICRWSQPFWRDEPVDIIMALEPQK